MKCSRRSRGLFDYFVFLVSFVSLGLSREAFPCITCYLLLSAVVLVVTQVPYVRDDVQQCCPNLNRPHWDEDLPGPGGLSITVHFCCIQRCHVDVQSWKNVFGLLCAIVETALWYLCSYLEDACLSPWRRIKDGTAGLSVLKLLPCIDSYFPSNQEAAVKNGCVAPSICEI